MFERIMHNNLKSEIDLRAEFDLLIFGSSRTPKHSSLFIIRDFRRSSDGKRIECTCIGELNRSASPDCSYCYGEGYLWDERWILGRSQFVGADGGLTSRYRHLPAGEVRADSKVMFFRYDSDISYGDKIIEVKLDSEGKLVVPYIRIAIYKPHTVNELRSDNGRIEFIAVYCSENDTIRLDTL